MKKAKFLFIISTWSYTVHILARLINDIHLTISEKKYDTVMQK